MRCKPCKNLRWPTAAPVQSSLSTTDVQTRCKSNYLRSETGWISRHFTDTIIVSSSFTKNGLSDTSIGCQVSPIGLFSGLMAGYRGHCKHTINNRGPTKPPKAKRKKKGKEKEKSGASFQQILLCTNCIAQKKRQFDGLSGGRRWGRWTRCMRWRDEDERCGGR